MQLSDRLYLIASGADGFGLTHPSDCHVYLVDGGSELALIDAGAGVEIDALMARLGHLPVEVDRIRRLFVTHAHADHAGGTAALRDALGVAVSCSPEVAAILRAGDERAASVDVGKAQGSYAPGYSYRPTPVDDELSDGQVVSVGEVRVRVVATPGHSTGHLCYLVDADGRTDLFTGDTLLFGGRIILQNTWDCDLRAHIDSLRRLGGHAFGGLFPGHRTISVTDGRRHLDRALEALDRGALPPTLA
jgi:hydroxyacylglutathione hydrolase